MVSEAYRKKGLTIALLLSFNRGICLGEFPEKPLTTAENQNIIKTITIIINGCIHGRSKSRPCRYAEGGKTVRYRGESAEKSTDSRMDKAPDLSILRGCPV